MYVYMYPSCTYVRMYVCMYVCMYACRLAVFTLGSCFMYVCMNVCLFVCLYVYMCVCLHVVSMLAPLCMHACMHACMYVYNSYIHTYRRSRLYHYVSSAHTYIHTYMHAPTSMSLCLFQAIVAVRKACIDFPAAVAEADSPGLDGAVDVVVVFAGTGPTE